MKRLLFVSALGVLTACGNPAGTPQQPSGLTKQASLIVGEEGFAFNYKVFALAGFTPFQTPYMGTLPEKPLADKADTCVVTSGDETDPLEQFDFLAAPLGNGESVGGPVTLSANGTTYATLLERDLLGSPIYGSGPSEESIAVPPLPESLTLTLPGESYSSVSGATLTPVARLEWTAPGQDDAVTPETAFSWTADDGAALIGFQVTQANEAGSGDDLNIFCLASDDGSFAFPAETQQDLTGLDSGKLMRMGRFDVRYESRGDTALLLASTSYLVFNLSAE